MKTNYITVPFEIERAKKITNKEEEGKIVTRDGRNVRIICWDARCDDNIVALVENENGVENPMSYTSDGILFLTSESPADLMLSVPEWSTFKSGDVVTMGREDTRGFPSYYEPEKKIKEYKFEPFDKVLVRDSKQKEWKVDIFREIINDEDNNGYKYSCFYDSWKYCIPYNEETKYLLNRTDDLDNDY